MIHGSRSSPSRKSVSAIFLAAEMASGFGSVLGSFGVRTAASAATFPFPFRSRKRAKERQPASVRISERLPAPSFRRAAMKARISAGVSLASCFSVGAEPNVGQKAQELDTSRLYASSVLADMRRSAPR